MCRPGAGTDAASRQSNELPGDGQVFAEGGDIVFQAAISDDLGLSDIRAVWFADDQSVAYAMVETTTPGVFHGAHDGRPRRALRPAHGRHPGDRYGGPGHCR